MRCFLNDGVTGIRISYEILKPWGVASKEKVNFFFARLLPWTNPITDSQP